MKKLLTLIFATALLLAGGTSFAQTEVGIGATAGVYLNGNVNPAAGVFTELKFSTLYSMRAGLEYNRLRGSKAISVDYNYDYRYISLPVVFNVGWYLGYSPVRLYLGIGLDFSYLAGTKYTNYYKYGDIGRYYAQYIKDFVLGGLANAGLSYTFGRNAVFTEAYLQLPFNSNNYKHQWETYKSIKVMAGYCRTLGKNK